MRYVVYRNKQGGFLNGVNRCKRIGRLCQKRQSGICRKKKREYSGSGSLIFAGDLTKGDGDRQIDKWPSPNQININKGTVAVILRRYDGEKA